MSRISFIEESGDIHVLTRKFPKEELYILTSQIKRAADSVKNYSLISMDYGLSSIDFIIAGVLVRTSCRRQADLLVVHSSSQRLCR
ncbi:MAG: four helix bundle protein [Candidatus Omnitrophica bacterium]|nr:four helix bundle protein [Candidatus Omnitrophota bacterium]